MPLDLKAIKYYYAEGYNIALTMAGEVLQLIGLFDRHGVDE